MHFDRCLGLAKLSPREQRKTQVNGCRVKGIERLFKLNCYRIALIELLSHANQNVAEILEGAPVSAFIGISKSGSGDVTSETNMVEFLLMGIQAGFDIPHALTTDHLGVCQTEELILG